MQRSTKPTIRATFARSLRHLAAPALGATLFSVFMVVGCGGSDSGGGGGKVCTTADVTALFSASKYGCSVSGCHDAQGTGGNFDMTTAGWETHLVGVAPKGGGTVQSQCGGMGQVYLKAGTPATGLFLDKIKLAPPACGAQMPMIGKKMTSDDIACVQSWADTLTAGAGS